MCVVGMATNDKATQMGRNNTKADFTHTRLLARMKSNAASTHCSTLRLAYNWILSSSFLFTMSLYWQINIIEHHKGKREEDYRQAPPITRIGETGEKALYECGNDEYGHGG